MSECYCHINPPCTHCMEKYECEKCGEFKHPSDDGQVETLTGSICWDCDEALGAQDNE